MNNVVDKSLILKSLKKHFEFRSESEFARFLSIKPQTLASWHTRNTFDVDLLYAKCNQQIERFNSDFLLSGRGDIQHPVKEYRIPSSQATTVNEKALNYNKPNEIPLVDAYAIGGFGGSDFSIQEHDVKENYVIPKFENKRVDFMIEVNGSSMYPKYNSGDVVACKVIRDSKIIQWNKTYVIATEENGILIKRLKKGTEPDSLLAISDNQDYDPFNIPKNEIKSLAIVVGVIRLE